MAGKSRKRAPESIAWGAPPLNDFGSSEARMQSQWEISLQQTVRLSKDPRMQWQSFTGKVCKQTGRGLHIRESTLCGADVL